MSSFRFRAVIMLDGGDVGTGVVSRQVFTSGSPS